MSSYFDHIEAVQQYAGFDRENHIDVAPSDLPSQKQREPASRAPSANGFFDRLTGRSRRDERP